MQRIYMSLSLPLSMQAQSTIRGCRRQNFQLHHSCLLSLLLSDLQGNSNEKLTGGVCQGELLETSQDRRPIGRRKGRVRSKKGRGCTVEEEEEEDCWVQCDNTECTKWRRIPKSHMKYDKERTCKRQRILSEVHNLVIMYACY